MTSPRSSYGGGYYSAPSIPDTPIYDSLVAERGTPQIAPIRVPAAYEAASYAPAPYAPASYAPALPSSLPALPAGPSQPSNYGYPQQGYGVAPLQQAPAPYIPQQAQPPRGYDAPQQQPRPAPGYQQQRPAQNTGYEAMRPVAPRPVQAAAPYDDPYNRQYQGGRGY